MLPTISQLESRRRLVKSLCLVNRLLQYVECDMYQMWDQYDLRRRYLGHSFSISHVECLDHGEGAPNLIASLKSWMRTHEEAQVMMASILVVVGLWWLVRTILSLLINLVCPLLVVLLAVVLVPQLRAPLLGQNYPAVANILHSILTKMAETVKLD